MSEQEMAAEMTNNVLRLVAAKELQRSNQILEALHERVTDIFSGVEKKEIESAEQVIDLIYRWIRDAFTSNIAAAHYDGIVSEEELIEATMAINGMSEDKAKVFVAELKTAYAGLDQSDA
jgi:hypothetical protein